jgi:hypothetical protein
MVRIAKRALIVDEGFFLIKRILILKAGQRDMLKPMLCYVCTVLGAMNFARLFKSAVQPQDH